MTDYRDRIRALAREPRTDWFRIVNVAETSSAEVYLYDEIGYFGTSAQAFVDEIRALDVTSIELHVNSPGGEVWDGIAILNCLRAHKATVTTIVDGVAASAASFIAMAGDEIVMARNSELMIHDAWGLCMGNAADMTELAGRLDQMSDNIASIYAEKAGGDIASWRETMRSEVWYSAQEAVDAGLADRVIAKDGEPAKAKVDLSVFNYAGRTHAPAPIAPVSASAAGSPAASAAEGSAAVEFTPEQITAITEALGIASDSDAQTITDAIVADEQADPPASNSTPPEGTVIVDQVQFEELRNQAAAGTRALQRQETDDRRTVVAAAVRDGRIPPARREAWEAQLAADPGAGEVLANMKAGLIPVDGERGYGDAPDLSNDDAIFASLFGGAGKEA